MNLSYNDNDNIFNLKIDEVSKSYLLETARWGKFLGILSIVMFVLGLLVAILMGAAMGSAMSSVPNYQGADGLAAMSTAMMITSFIISIVICIYPIYALLKFSNNIKPAIHTSNQEQFNMALGYLKGMFKYIGILMIIILAIYALIFIFAIIGGALASM